LAISQAPVYARPAPAERAPLPPFPSSVKEQRLSRHG
jgi:hypothetical protein